MSDDSSKRKYHCPMDRIARETVAPEVTETSMLGAFERTMAWMERAFEVDANTLSAAQRAQMFLHVMEHVADAFNESLAIAAYKAAAVFGVSEDHLATAVTKIRTIEMMKGFGDMLTDLDQHQSSTDPSKMEA